VFVDDHSGEKKEERKFTYDHAMWSHDDFDTEADGYNRPKPGSTYCDQVMCWDMLGTAILKKAWEGLNCTAFAYG